MWGANQTVDARLEDTMNRTHREIVDAIDEQIIRPMLRKYCELALKQVETREGQTNE